MKLSSCVLFLSLLGVSDAFVVPGPSLLARQKSKSRQSTELQMDPMYSNAMAEARGAFGLCLFGALGAAALGRSALSVIWSKFWLTQTLKGQGPKLGGDPIGLSPVTLYPEDIGRKDIEAVLNNNMTAAAIVEEFPQENTWPGFLSYGAFREANEGKNPLAIRAVFESLATTSNIVTPNQAQQAINAYKEDLGVMRDNLAKAKGLGYSAAIILVFLLALADFFTLYYLWHGWFPEWPAQEVIPFGLLDPDVGIMAIPKYWVGDIPSPSL